MNEPLAWINGSLVPFSQAAVPVWDMGLVAGAAVTEMARTYRHVPFRLPQHVNRLTSSLADLKFPNRCSNDALIEAAQSIVAYNARLIPSSSDLGIVLFSTAGSNATYLAGAADRVTTVVHTFELPFAMWKPSLENGVRLRVPSIRQIPDDCFPVHHKIRNRIHWWLADQQASQLEPGSKALLLDQEGFVTETSTSCVYAVLNGEIVTPDRNVLKSLSSLMVEELAALQTIPFVRRRISQSELMHADAVFLSSTPVGLLPVHSVDGRIFPQHNADSVCGCLMTAWNKIVGINMQDQILQDHALRP
jgi:branched-subunit amino acid aminotransferase/4-amino-4-deoxychorismate lyase